MCPCWALSGGAYAVGVTLWSSRCTWGQGRREALGPPEGGEQESRRSRIKSCRRVPKMLPCVLDGAMP